METALGELSKSTGNNRKDLCFFVHFFSKVKLFQKKLPKKVELLKKY